MTKQEQIEEMAKIIMGAIDETIQYKQAPANAAEATIEAEALYNAGYRKTFTSDLASDTQKAFKEGYRKGFEDRADKIDNLLTKLKTARIEAVKDFAESLKERLNADYVNGYLNTHKGKISENDIDELLKEYLEE